MQSSTANHYFTEDLNDSLFYEDDDNQQSQLIFNEHEEEENYPRGNVNGTKNGLTGLEIKGRVRTLSPVLFCQTNTQYLIMSNNELKYLPPEIANLVNLVYLDLSYNRLKTLPSQIGDLLHLKRLYLESNCLKNLPYELGKLDLDELGLSNNPLGDQILSLFARPNGTREVMNYLYEKWTSMCSYSKSTPYKMPLTWDNTEDDANNDMI
ncbi:unnamed protein product [Adineta ricciae]|uniref:Uncharacterized protein n=1 Tax=Adineta ricciae TaxID=249248 RepID=A0A813SC47_ADIRI|nr:unnamed protein product [Adineta ricciae]